MSDVITNHITRNPGVCGGRPCIAGRRVRVADIVAWHDHLGWSPDEIVSQLQGITLADVYAALAYYHDNRREMDEELAGDAEKAGTLQSGFPSILQEKLRGGAA